MKKLGTPENEDALNVDGSGGVTAEGVTAFAPVEAGADCGVPSDAGTTVRGWGCWARTSGAGVAGASVVVVVVVVLVGAGVEVGVGLGFGFGVVLVVVGDEAASEGAGSDGGAGTVVVPVELGDASEEPTPSLASATPANVSTSETHRSIGNIVVRARRVVMS